MTLADVEPKKTQLVKIVGRTVFCFRCEGSCAIRTRKFFCGSFLCALHLAGHACLVSSEMEYHKALLESLR